MTWACSIEECGRTFERVEELVLHQTQDHQRHECQICGTVVPDGYLAIRHAFEEHTRAEYVRAYDADSTAVRLREQVKEQIESEADLQQVVERLDDVRGGETPSSEGSADGSIESS